MMGRAESDPEAQSEVAFMFAEFIGGAAECSRLKTTTPPDQPGRAEHAVAFQSEKRFCVYGRYLVCRHTLMDA
jgi:hypothetical protein